MPRTARPWFRFSGDILCDPLVRSLPSSNRWFYVACLSVAAESPDPGRLLFSGGLVANARDIADIAAVSFRVSLGALRRLESRGLLVRDDGCWEVPDFLSKFGAPTREKIPYEVRFFVYQRDEFRCCKCGSTRRLTLDHVVPWSHGGGDEIENLRTLCHSCNSSRGAGRW